MAIGLVCGRVEERVLLVRTRRGYLRCWNHPDGDALLAAGVDIASVAQRHLRVGRVEAADVIVGQATPTANEHLPQRPVPAGCVLAHAATPASFSFSVCFCA